MVVVARLQEKVLRTLGRALTIRQVDAGSCNGCELEIHALGNPYYNIEGLGIKFVASPRHADLLLVTGPVTKHMAIALKRTYDATPEPKLVVAVGDCGCTGGIFGESYATLGRVANVIPVDVEVPGCPPTPTALLQGILAAITRTAPQPARDDVARRALIPNVGPDVRQLIVLGGGGFSQEKNRALDRHFLRADRQEAAARPVRRHRERRRGIRTGTSSTRRWRSCRAGPRTCRCSHRRWRTSNRSSQGMTPSSSAAATRGRCWRSGGNGSSIAVLHRAWRRGVVIGGVSAGMIAWFDWGVTDSVPGALTPLRCLRWLPGSACPHYDSEPERRPTYRRLVATGAIPGGLAADDGVALHFVDGALHDVVSARRKARAYRVERLDGRARETPIVPRRID